MDVVRALEILESQPTDDEVAAARYMLSVLEYSRRPELPEELVSEGRLGGLAQLSYVLRSATASRRRCEDILRRAESHTAVAASLK